MSASPGDAQPVFDLIVRHATELCDVPAATLNEYDGELVHMRSSYRSETIMASSALAAYMQLFPMRPTRGSITCRAILDRQIVHIRDLEADPELAGFVRELGHRSQVSVPLIRDGLAIGVISIDCPRTRRLLRQPDRTAENLRRAGGDRDHQRGDVSRVADPHERSSGNAGIPDGDQRCAEGHQPFDLRACSRCSRRWSRPPHGSAAPIRRSSSACEDDAFRWAAGTDCYRNTSA